MVDINDIYKSQSEYMRAEDIGNEFWTFTIKSADVKHFKEGDSKIILTFVEWEKGLPLNITNAKTIASLYGHNSNDWVGRQVMLFTMMVDFQGKPTLAIRIRAPQQMGQPPQQQYRPGAMQPQANMNMGPAQTSHQRPLDYAQQSGAYNEMNPPPPTENPYQ